MAAPRSDAHDTTTPDPAPPGATARRRRYPRFSIQSKLLVMLLVVSILSTITIGALGFISGIDALQRSVFDRLTGLRQSRKGQIERYFDALGSQLVVLSRDPTINRAMRNFNADFAALQNTQLPPEQLARRQAFFEDDVAAQLSRNVTGTPALADFEQQSNAAAYLQFYYSIGSTDPQANSAVDDAGDGSRWSATHRAIHPFLRDMANRLEFDDLLLVDRDGNIVYTVSKSIDLGANLRSPAFASTLLGTTFVDVIGSATVDNVVFVDYQHYVPSFSVPTAFVLTPIHQAGVVEGVIVVKLPVEVVDRIMTDAGNWEADGQGQTGETYLAGNDYLMRSQSRFLLQDPQAFAQQVRSAGTPEQTIERMLALNTTILEQPVRSPSVEAAVRGASGTLVTTDYRNIDVLTSYAPVELPGLDWVIVAKIDTSEAFAPQNAFARWLLLSTSGIVVVVTLASLLLAQVFARPIRKLTAGARRVAAGDTSTSIQASGRDELGELARAFDSLRTAVLERDRQLAEREQESQRLLRSFMPATVAQRYLSGESVTAQDHPNVAVIAATLDGWNTVATGMDAERSSTMLSEFVRAADEAAERTGVEGTRMVGSSYLATSGLMVPRVDYARRAVDFARELTDIIERFNSRNNLALHGRIGIDVGTVTSALLGASSVSYDVWGAPVEMARRLKGHMQVEGILVSDRVYRRLREVDNFEPAGTIDTPDGTQAIWALVEKRDVERDVPSGTLQR